MHLSYRRCLGLNFAATWYGWDYGVFYNLDMDWP